MKMDPLVGELKGGGGGGGGCGGGGGGEQRTWSTRSCISVGCSPGIIRQPKRINERERRAWSRSPAPSDLPPAPSKILVAPDARGPPDKPEARGTPGFIKAKCSGAKQVQWSKAAKSRNGRLDTHQQKKQAQQ